MDTTEMKQLRDDAQAALKAVNDKVDELKKDQDALVTGALDKANAEFDAKYAKWEGEFNKVETEAKAAKAAAEQLEARLAKLNTGLGGDEAEAKAMNAKLADAFYGEFVRKGATAAVEAVMAEMPEEVKRLSSDQDAQAGYLLAPATLEAEITRIVTEISPVRQFADVQTISTEELQRNVNVAGSAARWADQDVASSGETTNPSFKKLRFYAHNLDAEYHASQNLLADARVDIEQLFAQEMGIAMGEKEAEAFVDGDGINKPRGFLDYTKTLAASYTGAWETIETHITGAAGAFQAAGSGPEEVFIDTIHSLKQPYQANARFYLSRGTLGEVRKIKDGDGRPLFMWDGSMPGTIAGEPFSIFQQMPAVADDAYAIAYADLRAAYQVVDRAGLNVIRDPYSAKPDVQFFGRKRVGGGVKMFEAIKLIQFAD